LHLFELENLQKRYGHFEAIRGLTIRVEEGAIGLLGPNGAGKSTLIKTLLGLLPFSGGAASVLGHRLPEGAMAIRREIGYMPENDCYLPYMTAVQYVSFGGQLAGMPAAEAFRRAHEVLYYVGLQEARYRALQGFSTGMKQRVKLAQALVHGPKLVFLDEPTNGLDPKGREEMLELILDVRERGVNVVLCTHLLADVERVCDSVIMMNQGTIIHYSSLKALKQSDGRVLEVETKQANDQLRALMEARGWRVEQAGLKLKLHIPDGADDQDVLRAAREAGIQLRHFMPAELTLESAFLGLLERDAHARSQQDKST
jgi:ABC-2 type transport system ATP-binding protein